MSNRKKILNELEVAAATKPVTVTQLHRRINSVQIVMSETTIRDHLNEAARDGLVSKVRKGRGFEYAPITSRRRPAGMNSSTRTVTLNERQSQLLRVVKQMFSDFNQRQQHFYLGAGASTSHVAMHAVQDFKTLTMFWPPELVRRGLFPSQGHLYTLESDTLRRVQNAVRETLKQLEKKGELEKIGNTDERRWKPTYR